VTVVDASVAIKPVLHEPDSAIALASLRTRTWTAPDLIMSECANIIWKRWRLGEIKAEQAAEAVRLVEALYIHIEPSRRLFARATQLAIELQHPAYDCFYIAHAESEGDALLTADIKLINKVRQSSATSIEILSLQEYAKANGL
jgi:predicted nucleic acid-binding protein